MHVLQLLDCLGGGVDVEIVMAPLPELRAVWAFEFLEVCCFRTCRAKARDATVGSLATEGNEVEVP
jgi:hypothetical protein